MGDARHEVHLGQPAPAWAPVIYFIDGRVMKIEGCWPHDKAMAMAEQAACHLDGAESYGAQRLR